MVGLKVGPIFYKIGNGNILHSFFSTVAYNLENNKWGSRFPLIMEELYYRSLPPQKLDLASEEIKKIFVELQEYAPSMVIWDIEDLAKRPPWGDNIAETITSLDSYFYTSDGENLSVVFDKALETAKRVNKEVLVYSL